MANGDRMALKLMLDSVIEKIYMEREKYLVLFKSGGATFISGDASFVAKSMDEKNFGFENMLPAGFLAKLRKWEPALF